MAQSSRSREVGPGQLIHQAGVAGVTVGDEQLLEQPREAQAADREALAAGLVAQGAGELLGGGLR
jgi:hypothetical protein